MGSIRSNRCNLSGDKIHWDLRKLTHPSTVELKWSRPLLSRRSCNQDSASSCMAVIEKPRTVSADCLNFGIVNENYNSSSVRDWNKDLVCSFPSDIDFCSSRYKQFIFLWIYYFYLQIVTMDNPRLPLDNKHHACRVVKASKKKISQYLVDCFVAISPSCLELKPDCMDRDCPCGPLGVRHLQQQVVLCGHLFFILVS